MSKAFRQILVGTSLGLSLLMVCCVAFYGLGYRINLTPSLPYGVWRIAEIKDELSIGEYVVFCPTKRAMGVLQKDGVPFLVRKFKCKGDFAPLLKRIEATAGQRVVINKEGVFVDGEFIAISSASKHRLSQYDRVLELHEAFVLADHPYSVDSRILGALDKSLFYASAVPVVPLTMNAL